MSHMAAIDLYVTDLFALELACESLGVQLNKNQTNWRWYGDWVDDYHAKEAAYRFGIDPSEYGKCAEHVITIPGNNQCYEIGVVRRRDGKPGWMLVYDFYGEYGRMMTEKIQGKDPSTGKIDNAGLLKQAYAAGVAGARLKKHFPNVKLMHLKNGHFQTVATRPKQKQRTFK